jgi:hypothetical protein
MNGNFTMTTKKLLTAEELDALHDSGVDMTPYVDLASSRRPGLEAQRINVDFPHWMVASLDREAGRLGITRQSMIKYWIAERLDALQRAASAYGAPRLDSPPVAEDPAPYGDPPARHPKKPR